MSFDEFYNSLSFKNPPDGINDLLIALWHDAKGDWEKSHNIAQDIDTKNGALIHAYLHRKEGDDWNANYWYQRAGKKMPDVKLEEEWKLLVMEFIKK